MPTIAYQGPTAIISGAIATGAGSTYEVERRISGNQKRVFQATGTTSAGAGAATIVVEVSLTGTTNEWITLGTITLTLGTTVTTDGFAMDAAWTYVRGNVTAISGTDATVNLYMGV
jgi:hypothetical protein